MKKKIMMFIITALSIINIQAKSYESANVYRYDDNGARNLVCNVQYYVSGDTLFVNQQFKHLGFIFSDNSTGKMILKQESVLFYNQHKGNWWYVIVNNKNINKPNNSYLSAIVLRDCMYGVKPKSVHRCADAYLYNITKEIPANNGSRILNNNLSTITKGF